MFTGEDKRDRLFRAALQVFAEKGFNAAGVEEIVARAGVAKGTLYYHFASKDELFLVLMETGIEILGDHIRRRAKGVADPMERLRVVAEEQVRFFAHDRDFYKLLMSEIWWLDEKWHERVQSIRSRYLSILRDALGDGQKAGIIRDDLSIELLAPGFFGLVSHMLLHRLMLDLPVDVSELVRTVQEAFFHGIAVSEAATQTR